MIQASSMASTTSDLFVFKYGSKRVMAKRQPCYQAAIQSCRSLFPELRDCEITFNTKDLDICDNEMTVIPEESWATAVTQLNCVVVITEEKEDSADVVASGSGRQPVARRAKIKVSILLCDGRSFSFSVSPSSRIKGMLDRFSESVGECAENFRYLYDGHVLEADQTFDFYSFVDGDIIDCFKSQSGRKPVIYLSSPTPLQAFVKLSLAPQWDFSAIYPVVPIKPRTESSEQEICWKVDVHPNGDLTELTTGLDVAYLFWEAHTNPTIARPPSPPPSPGGTASTRNVDDVFYPNSADLRDSDSVVLPIDKVPSYLDKVLSALCLHTEARTSFITYWLPSLLKHKYVALRFLPQKAYENAAPLAVSPAPDVVTRVFMIFKGISDDELAKWSTATKKASEDVRMWQDIVGVQYEHALDAKLFRVLEWGGMEVLRRA